MNVILLTLGIACIVQAIVCAGCGFYAMLLGHPFSNGATLGLIWKLIPLLFKPKNKPAKECKECVTEFCEYDNFSDLTDH